MRGVVKWLVNFLIIIKWVREFPYKCPNKECVNVFKQDRMNDQNLNIHQERCTYEKKIVKATGRIAWER